MFYPEVVEILVQHDGSLGLGLTSITPQVAGVLSRYKGWLNLNSLKTIHPESAGGLSENQEWISLNGPTTVTPEIVGLLASGNSILGIQGLREMDAETATALKAAD